jgi:hypothetical protein
MTDQSTDGTERSGECGICGSSPDIIINEGAEHVPMGPRPMRVCATENGANIHYLEAGSDE